MGNRVTADELILREMRLKPGVRISDGMIEEDRLRVASLGLFNRVMITVESDDDRAVVLVNVSEPFYIYPFIMVAWDPQNPSEQTYGLIAYHRNFRGYGERLGGAAWTGSSQGFSLFHQDPWFSLGGKYGLDGRIRYSEGSATDSDQDERITKGAGLSIRRRLGILSSLSWAVDWMDISTSDEEYTLTPGTRDRVVTLGWLYSFDHRDYRYYPGSGRLVRIGVEANRIVDLPHNYFRQSFEYRSYRSINAYILAWRFRLSLAQEILPEYHLMSVSRSKMRAGTAYERNHGGLAVSNLEYRFNLIKKRYYDINGVPYLSQYMQNMKFSLEALVFNDFGLALDYEDLLDQAFHAFGCGLQVQLPYVETIHMLAGWTARSKIGKPNLSAGLGVTF